MSSSLDQFQFAVSQIKRLLVSAEKVPHLPIVVAPETTEYVNKLESTLRHNPEKTESLISAFIPQNAFLDRLMAESLPRSVLLLQKAYLETRKQKELCVSSGQFANAAICRDKEHQILSDIGNSLNHKEIVITPQHLIGALVSMGLSLDDGLQ